MIRRLSPLIAIAALAACATPPVEVADPNVPPPAPLGRCDATKAQRLIGQPATPALIDSARRESAAALTRLIKPGTMVTMDYRQDRLNVTVDEQNRITAIRCG